MMRRPLLAAVILLGVTLRLLNVWRPFDGRTREPWREADMSAVARNFDREGLDPLRPRIDWRGDGPGYAEMEFPALPALMALSYRVVGVHEVVGRLIDAVLSIATLVVFVALARDLLSPAGTVVAALFFALGPLLIRVATTIQPDGIMMLCYVIAAAAFIRWLEHGTWASYITAIVATAAAILGKAPAAHIGLFFIIALLLDRGLVGTVRDWRVWVFAALALGPAVAWYGHAHELWLRYGNSLGVSNEDHWISRDFFTSPRLVAGIAREEIAHVWMWTGVPLAILGAVAGRHTRAVRYALAWLAAIAVYYALASHTTSEEWASYYHIVSAPAVALLIGAAGEAAVGWWRSGRWRVAVAGGALLFVATCLVEIRKVIADIRYDGLADLYTDANVFAPSIASGARIVATGGHCTDPAGRAVAWNASYMFYWTDHKGFNICIERQSVPAVDSLVRRGARYFVAERNGMDAVPGFGDAMRHRYRVVAEGKAAVLFDLSPSYAGR